MDWQATIGKLAGWLAEAKLEARAYSLTSRLVCERVRVCLLARLPVSLLLFTLPLAGWLAGWLWGAPTAVGDTNKPASQLVRIKYYSRAPLASTMKAVSRSHQQHYGIRKPDTTRDWQRESRLLLLLPNVSQTDRRAQIIVPAPMPITDHFRLVSSKCKSQSSGSRNSKRTTTTTTMTPKETTGAAAADVVC